MVGDGTFNGQNDAYCCQLWPMIQCRPNTVRVGWLMCNRFLYRLNGQRKFRKIPAKISEDHTLHMREMRDDGHPIIQSSSKPA